MPIPWLGFFFTQNLMAANQFIEDCSSEIVNLFTDFVNQ